MTKLDFLFVAIAIVIIFSLVGCSKREPEERAETSNQHYKVDRLFDFEGCVMYRFYDKTEWHYYVNCKDHPSNWVVR